MLFNNSQLTNLLSQLENTSDCIFVTGQAGTGKSTLLSHFRNHTHKQVVVLAPTGVAAVNVKGVTIHSFFHFKPDITVTKAKALAAKSRNSDLYNNLDSIIIDEISMVRADLLDCVDSFMRRVTKKDKPFGGKQVIFFGDLYQLPPVTTKNDEQIFRSLLYDSPYFFSSSVMSQIKLKLVELNHIYRQKDERFIKLLNNMRNNKLTADDYCELNRRVNPDYLPLVEELVIYLTTTNSMADSYNTQMLQELRGETRVFKAISEGVFDKKTHPVPDRLELKIGAQVMLAHNDPEGRFINGTMAKVISLDADGEEGVTVELADGQRLTITPRTWEMFQFVYDQTKHRIESSVVGKYTQLPLNLAWAITIHKSQGKTFHKAVLDLGYGAFAHGQTYVALSRCVTLNEIILTKPITPSSIITDQVVATYLNSLRE